MGISDPGSSWKRFELEEKSQVYLAEVETFVPLPAILPKYGCRDWKKTNCIFENNFRGLRGDIVEESKSEKLLGVVISNTATWHHHLHGDEDNAGLLSNVLVSWKSWESTF